MEKIMRGKSFVKRILSHKLPFIDLIVKDCIYAEF
jgi:hypothetical protein